MKPRRVFLIVLSAAVALGQQASDGPAWTADSKLLRPAGYRDWVHLSTSLGLQYGKASAPSSPPSFENVYVNPAAWQEFSKTGKWPEGSLFVLEVRASETRGSLAKGGQFQGEVVGMELEVKDSKRFPDGWAWFDLPAGAASAKPFPKAAGCFACHTAQGAVEKTFTQFYPRAMEIAKEKGAVNESYKQLVESGAFEK
jgi:hypothetical protein